MKKISSFLLFVLFLFGCYQDLGNYDYKLDSMNEITSATFTPSVANDIIEVQQALDENDRLRRVDVVVDQTLADSLEDLEFYWFRTFVDEDGKPVQDTIRTKGYLEFYLPVGKEMSYNIFLQIYDRTTDLSHYSKFKIQTRPMFKNSLFVLHGSDGNRKIGNIEVIGNDTKIYTDIKTITEDNNHYENATGFGYTTFYNSAPGESFYFSYTLTVFSSNGETRAYDHHDKMKLKFTSSQIFKPESENFSYRQTQQTGWHTVPSLYKIVLSESGEVYIGNVLHALYKPGYGCENDTNSLHQTDYKITAAAITHNRFLMWDAKNNRFLYAAKEDANGFAPGEAASLNPGYKSTRPVLDAHVNYQGLQRSPEGMTAVMGYINYRDNAAYEYQNPYFIFKDETTGDYYRYELQQRDGAKVKVARGVGAARENANSVYTIVGEKKLTGLTPTDMSTITYNSWFTTDYLFFAEGNTVYRYNVSNGDRMAVYEAPAGYDVTKIKFRTDDSAKENGDIGRYLNIVMYNGTNGAVAEIKFTTAADVDNDFAPLFYDRDNAGNLWEEIKDIIFAYEYKQD